MKLTQVITTMATCAVLAFCLTGCSGLGSSRLDTRISASRFFRWPIPGVHGEKRETLEDPFLPEPNTAVATNSKAKSESRDQQTGLNTETLVLFETEFRDASPQERQKWLEQIRDVPPEMVPQILRARRLAMERATLAEAPVNSTPRNEQNSLVAGHSINNVSPWASSGTFDNDKTGSFDQRSNSNMLSDSRGPVGLGQLEAMTESTVDANYRKASFEKEFSAPSPLERRFMQQRGENVMPSLPAQSPREIPLSDERNLNDPFPLDRIETPPVMPVAATVSPDAMPQINPGSNYSSDGTYYPQAHPTPPAIGTIDQPGSDASMWNMQLTQLISLAEAEAARLPVGTTPEQKRNYIAKHVYLRMLYLMGDQQVRAMAAIEGIDSTDQEFWQQMFWAMSNYFDEKGMPDPSDRASQTIAQLTTAIDRLQAKARLELRNVSFSHKIDGFGNFQRFDRDEFKAGQPVLVYAELRNFKSEPNPQGLFRTLIKSRIEIYKAGPNGGLVFTQDFPATEDLSSSLRHDYYHSYMLRLPETLTLGPHILKLTLEDQLSNKLASYSLRFAVN